MASGQDLWGLLFWGLIQQREENMSLARKTCVPCKAGAPPLPPSEVGELLAELEGWQVSDGKKLVKRIKLENFARSLELANKIGAIAEKENHHPDLLVRWGSLGIEIWTHVIDGLTENDFILAAKIDNMLKRA
jgi:4a-hydroxytetrahydrobiopterin dehydratase